MPAPTRFTKLQVGDRLDSGINQLQAFGNAVVSQSVDLAYTNSSAVNVGVIPANSQIIDIYVDITTAFNAGTNNNINLGTSGTTNLFASNLSGASAARVLGSSSAAKLANYRNTGSSQITLQALYTQSGTAASAGAAVVTVVYVPGNALS